MGSICGYVDFARSGRNIKAFMDGCRAMRGRGADRQGAYIKDGVALASLERGKGEACGELAFLESNGCVLSAVIEGYISNSESLSRELSLFRGVCTAELVLIAFKAFGYDFLSRLEGAFSIAIYDEFNCELILARDSDGKKPLFLYNLNGGGIAFASEIKGLLPFCGVGEIDRTALVSLILGEKRTPKGLYKGVSELSAGSFYVCTPLGIRKHGYSQNCGQRPRGQDIGTVRSEKEVCPTLMSLTSVLIAFDHPVFDPDIMGFISSIEESEKNERKIICDRMLSKDKNYALMRADRLGMQRGILIELIENEPRKKERGDLSKQEEKELSRMARELLLTDSHMKLFFDVDKLLKQIEALPRRERICGYARAIESELLLRMYPVCVI